MEYNKSELYFWAVEKLGVNNLTVIDVEVMDLEMIDLKVVAWEGCKIGAETTLLCYLLIVRM